MFRVTSIFVATGGLLNAEGLNKMIGMDILDGHTHSHNTAVLARKNAYDYKINIIPKYNLYICYLLSYL